MALAFQSRGKHSPLSLRVAQTAAEWSGRPQRRHTPLRQSCRPQRAKVVGLKSKSPENLHSRKPSKLARCVSVLPAGLCQGPLGAIQVCLSADPFHSLIAPFSACST